MKIIRDNDLGGLAMIPLLVDWDVKRCNVDQCLDKPSTIVRQLASGIPLAGFCETHFQQANAEGGAKFDLTFDDFDAFAASTREDGR